MIPVKRSTTCCTFCGISVLIELILWGKAKLSKASCVNISALEDHEKSDLDPDQDHLPKSDLRSRSDPDLT